MKLVNKTQAGAELLRTGSQNREDHMLGCVIARPTFRVKNGALVATPDEPWPITAEPTDTPLGKMPGDRPHYTGGVDVLLGGTVRQPSGAPRPRLDVELTVGRTFRRRIAVFGERRWVRGEQGKLTPSPPDTFVTMELRYERAFGGLAKTTHGPMPYTANRDGKGFCTAADAAGKELANLEDPNQLVTSIDDQPEPVGLGYYPIDGALRVQGAVKRASPSEPIRPDAVLPTLFNMAHPRMVIPVANTPKKGEMVRLSHGTREGDLAFAMPDLSMHVHVQLAERQYAFPLYLDQIGVVAGEARVFFSLRCVFQYRVVKRERRQATLYAGPVPDPIPPEYRIAWQDGWDKDWWDKEEEELG